MELTGDEKDSERESEDSEELRLVLVGITGCGKSASGNTILGRRHFLSQASASSITQSCELGSTALSEEEEGVSEAFRRVTVVDMPGFGDTRFSVEQIHAEVAKCVALSAPGPHAFLLVVPVGRYTDEQNQAVVEMAQIFGEDALRHHTLVLFTRGDDLDGVGMEEYLQRTAPAALVTLMDRCGGRYHVFNNRESGNALQVKELLTKVDRMVTESSTGFYTNAMFSGAEAAIKEEQRVMLRERGDGDAEEGRSDRVEEERQRPKRRKCDLESDKGGEGIPEGLSAVSLFRERFRSKPGTASRRRSLRSSLRSLRREAALSPKVIARIKILVAAGATGMAVGAVFGAAAPLAAAAGASLLGNSLGLAAGQLAGVSAAGGGVGEAVGAIVAAASGKTALALGAATGGMMGGSVGTVVGAGAASPSEGALDALGQVSIVGASTVGVATGVGGALGAGAALGAALGTAAAGAAETAVAVAGGGLASVAVAPPCAAASAASAAAVAESWVPVATTTTRILQAVAEIGKAAAGIALAGGLVVKVVKEKVRCGSGTTEASYSEKKSYEVYWNK